MGWWESITGSKHAEDPLKSLDPKLRDFLQKESPVKFEPGKASADEATPPRAPKQAAPGEEPLPADPQAAAREKSLYKDGRYSHLWKTYQPLENVEAATKSSHEKLTDVLEGYKERKTSIGKAALENCAFEQEEWRRCMLEGSWGDAMTMCRTQVRKFERCYTMQSRFLRVLGYQSIPGRSQDLEDDIQLHADTLYQRMIAHEELAAKAREEGRPIPAFEVLPPPVAAKTPPAPSEDMQKMWKEQVEKLPEEDRAAEEAALRADYYAKLETAKKLRDIRQGEDAERRKRKEEGKATLGDHFWGMLGWGGSGKDGGSGA